VQGKSLTALALAQEMGHADVAQLAVGSRGADGDGRRRGRRLERRRAVPNEPRIPP